MGEKVSKIRSMCSGKRGYATRNQAKAIRNKMKRCGNKNIEIYQCQYCDLFHIGHQREPGRIKRWI